MSKPLTHPQIGYLRVMPSSNHQGNSAVGPRKAAWTKLTFTPYARREFGELYHRTAEGDAEVARFEAAIPPSLRDLIARLAAGEPVPRKTPGLTRLVEWQVAYHSGSSGSARLTQDGADLHARLSKSPAPATDEPAAPAP